MRLTNKRTRCAFVAAVSTFEETATFRLGEHPNSVPLYYILLYFIFTSSLFQSRESVCGAVRLGTRTSIDAALYCSIHKLAIAVTQFELHHVCV